jgi:hypothetical protein
MDISPTDDIGVAAAFTSGRGVTIGASKAALVAKGVAVTGALLATVNWLASGSGLVVVSGVCRHAARSRKSAASRAYRPAAASCFPHRSEGIKPDPNIGSNLQVLSALLRLCRFLRYLSP